MVKDLEGKPYEKQTWSVQPGGDRGEPSVKSQPPREGKWRGRH